MEPGLTLWRAIFATLAMNSLEILKDAAQNRGYGLAISLHVKVRPVYNIPNFLCSSHARIVVVQCTEVLSSPENGNLVKTGNIYQSEAEYECDEGYALVGLMIRVCQADGQWSGSEPHCEGT